MKASRPPERLPEYERPPVVEVESGRVSRGAFTPTEMSVDVARLRKHMRLTLEGGESVGVVAFSSTAAYDNGQQVVSDPQEDNEAHALVIGKKSPSVRKALRNASTFFPSAEIE